MWCRPRVFGYIGIHRRPFTPLNLSKEQEGPSGTDERMCYEQIGFTMSCRSRTTDNESEHHCNQDRVHDRTSVRLLSSADSAYPVRDGCCTYQLLAWNL